MAYLSRILHSESAGNAAALVLVALVALVGGLGTGLPGLSPTSMLAQHYAALREVAGVAWFSAVILELCFLFRFAAAAVDFCKPKGATSIGRLCAVLLVTTLIPASFLVGTEVRKSQFRRLATRAQPWITALEAYRQKNGQYPSELGTLVPEYLPGEPQTDMIGHREVRYRRDVTAGGRGQYEIVVPCGTGLMNWDVFVYRPHGRYESTMYGGWSEPIAEWVYVHE